MVVTFVKPTPASSKPKSEIKSVYCDGSCVLNDSGGWGAIVYYENGSTREVGGFDDSSSTNQRMELRAAIAALELIKESGSTDPITVYSDSRYTINCATQWIAGWKRRDWIKTDGKPVLNRDLLEALDALSDVPVRWEWVKGHSKIEGNEAADRVASECRKEQKNVNRIDGTTVPISNQDCLSTTETPRSLTFGEFQEQVRDKFVRTSCFDPEFLANSTRFVRDTETSISGDVTYPIAEALNWHVSRFGRKHRDNQFAVLFEQESGATWQAKLAIPFVNRENGKVQKYTAPTGDKNAPKGSNDRVWLPIIPPAIRERVAKRYGVEVPMYGSFWEWVSVHPELEIIITEGAGKAGSLLSLGYIAIALYGCSSGNSPDLEQFIKPDSRFVIAFDEDTNPKTRYKVNGGICSLGIRIRRGKGEVRVMCRNASGGKGIDDLQFLMGPEAVERAIVEAKPFQTWRSSYLTDLTVPIDYAVNSKRITDEDIEAIVEQMPAETKLILVKAPKGFGKTYMINKITEGRSKLVLGHRVQLMAELGRVFSIPDLQSIRRKVRKAGEASPRLRRKARKEDEDTSFPFREVTREEDKKEDDIQLKLKLPGDRKAAREGSKCKEERPNPAEKIATAFEELESLALCVNSFQPESDPGFTAEEWFDVDYVVIDEIEQVIWHLLDSETLSHGKRVLVGRELIKLLRHWVSSESHTRLIAADADLSLSVNFIHAIVGDVPTYTIGSVYNNASFDVFDYPNKEAWFSSLMEKAAMGKRIFIATSAQAETSRYGTIALENALTKRFPKLKILRIDSDTLELMNHPAYGCMAHLDETLSQYDIVIASPSIETGVSIDIRGHFDYEFDYQGGNLPEANARQQMNRVREPIERHLFASDSGSGWVSGTSALCSVAQILEASKELTKAKANLLDMSLVEGELDATFLQEALITWASMAARINSGFFKYHDSLVEGLRGEGCRVISAAVDCDREAIRDVVDENQASVLDAKLTAIVDARQLTRTEFDAIDGKAKQDALQQVEAERYELSARYSTQDVTKDLAGKDAHGWHKAISLHYYLTVGREHLSAREARKVNANLKDGKIFSPDLNRITIADKVSLLDAIGFTAILSRMEGGEAIANNDSALEKLKSICDEYPKAVKKVLGVDLKASNAPHTMLGKLLEVVGLTKWETCARVPDPEISNRSSSCNQKQGQQSQKVKAWKLPTLEQLIGKKEKDAKTSLAVNVYDIWAIDDGRAEVFARWMSAEVENNPSNSNETASRQNVPENQQNEAEDNLASPEAELADLIEMWSDAIDDLEVQQSLINSWRGVIDDRYLAQLPGYLGLVHGCNVGSGKMTEIGYDSLLCSSSNSQI